ncbi:MAG: monofunctional biosynthetic peptidoglycan transglycosylase [Gammaproteobacteria bacterium]|nr:monofunctional biosynthetic peptidoglycan transglycosylase [Gammaproteobacteria bacterium]
MLWLRFRLWLSDLRISRLLRWFLSALFLLVLFDVAYLVSIWPDWDAYRSGPIRQSSFIQQYVAERKQHKWPQLKWTPISMKRISKNMRRALIVAEDANFYWHDGIDLAAFWAAMEHNIEEKRFVYGGSTISQQVVKNLFLSPSRNPLRKWHELVLTLVMESKLRKKRILELYLNVAEFGRGIYGVEAAARHYWGVSASRLSRSQATQLAASLPAPSSHNPSTRTRFFQRRVRKIDRYF